MAARKFLTAPATLPDLVLFTWFDPPRRALGQKVLRSLAGWIICSAAAFQVGAAGSSMSTLSVSDGANGAITPFLLAAWADPLGNDLVPGCSLVVTTTTDGGPGSLRAAIICANNTPGPDTILLPPGVYNLELAGPNEDAAATGDLDITDSLTIVGSGATNTIIDGNHLDRIFDVRSGTNDFALSGLTLRHGQPQGRDEGGAIQSRSMGHITIDHCLINDNTSPHAAGAISLLGNGGLTLIDSTLVNNRSGNGDDGGAVSFYSPVAGLTVTRCRFENNVAPDGGGGAIAFVSLGSGVRGIFSITDSVFINNESGPGTTGGAGGALYVLGAATIGGTTFTGNSSGGDGGAIYNRGTNIITGSTFTGNSAGKRGGAINTCCSSSSLVLMTNSTLSANSASDLGGAIQADGPVTLVNVTLSGNTAPKAGAVWNDNNGSVTLFNTLVASSGTNNLAGGTFASLGHNLSSDNSGTAWLTAPGDRNNADPRLGPLSDNGGPTQTHALLSGSPAIDAGENNGAPGVDQRGVKRPQGVAVDIGAFEAAGVAPPAANLALTLADSPDPVVVSNQVIFTITLTNAGPASATSVIVTNILPPGTVATSISGDSSQTNGLIIFRVGALASADTARLTFAIRPLSAGSLTSTATVSAAELDPDLANNSVTEITTVTPAPIDLTIDSDGDGVPDAIELRAGTDPHNRESVFEFSAPPVQKADGTWTLTVSTVPGRTYKLQYLDLSATGTPEGLAWVDLSILTATGPRTVFEDPTSVTASFRLYRAVLIEESGPDSTAPSVSLPQLSPRAPGEFILSVVAQDNVGVTGVDFFDGATRLGAAARVAANRWVLTNRFPINSLHTIKAAASDLSNNRGFSDVSTIFVPDPDRLAPVDNAGQAHFGDPIIANADGSLPAVEYRPGGRDPTGRDAGFRLRFPDGVRQTLVDGQAAFQFTKVIPGFGPNSPLQFSQSLLNSVQNGVPAGAALQSASLTRTLRLGPVDFNTVVALFGGNPEVGLEMNLFGKFVIIWKGGIIEEGGIRRARFSLKGTGLPILDQSADYSGFVLELPPQDGFRLPFHGQFTIPDGSSTPPQLTVGRDRPLWLGLKPDGQILVDGRADLAFPGGPSFTVDLGIDDPFYHLQMVAKGLSFPLLSSLADLLPPNPGSCVPFAGAATSEQLRQAIACLQRHEAAYASFSTAALADRSSSNRSENVTAPPSPFRALTALLDAYAYSGQAVALTHLPGDPLKALFAQTGRSAAAARFAVCRQLPARPRARPGGRPARRPDRRV